MPTMTDAEIKKEWEHARVFYRAQERLRYGYRPIGYHEAPGFGLATRLFEGSMQRLESAGVTEADIDRLGLPSA